MVGGGCIHRAWRCQFTDGGYCFIKGSSGESARLLEAERRGLERLAPHIRVPEILASGAGGVWYWIALEWLELRPLGPGSWEDLGRRLRGLHSTISSRHGLDHDNFIGATPQENRPCESWREFFLERRLTPQLRRARGYGIAEGSVLRRAEEILADHEPRPSLLHGDLWTGNAAALKDGGAVVFDPAPYFGDPETDLAMLELFGSPLPVEFLLGYGPVDPGRQRRRSVYDLYHALNHVNLFGEGYLSMVRRCLETMA